MRHCALLCSIVDAPDGTMYETCMYAPALSILDPFGGAGGTCGQTRAPKIRSLGRQAFSALIHR